MSRPRKMPPSFPSPFFDDLREDPRRRAAPAGTAKSARVLYSGARPCYYFSRKRGQRFAAKTDTADRALSERYERSARHIRSSEQPRKDGSARRADASAYSRRVHRAGRHRRQRFAAQARHRRRSSRELHFLRSSGDGQDHTRAYHRREHPRGVRQTQRRDKRRSGREKGHRGGPRTPSRERTADLSAARRVPPLEQGAVGQRAPGDRAGLYNLHRFHHRKSLRFHDPRHSVALPRFRILAPQGHRHRKGSPQSSRRQGEGTREHEGARGRRRDKTPGAHCRGRSQNGAQRPRTRRSHHDAVRRRRRDSHRPHGSRAVHTAQSAGV